MVDKVEWINKLRAIINPKGAGPATFDGPSGPIRQSRSEGSLVSKNRMVIIPKDLVRWIVQNFVLGLAANVEWSQVKQNDSKSLYQKKKKE